VFDGIEVILGVLVTRWIVKEHKLA
jgi:hypothetical protein